jgi:hypothetical protein
MKLAYPTPAGILTLKKIGKGSLLVGGSLTQKIVMLIYLIGYDFIITQNTGYIRI